MKTNLSYFEIQDGCFAAQKVGEKLEPFLKFAYLAPGLWSFNCQKICCFCNFVLISARKFIIYLKIMYYNLHI